MFASKYSSESDNLKISGLENYPPVAGSYNFAYTSGSSTGTLNSEVITGTLNSTGNKVFLAKSGDSKNISVELLSDISTSTTVRYGESLIDKLQKYVSDITSGSGAIEVRTSSLKQNLLEFGEEQTDLDAKIKALTEAYNVKFGAMESLVTQLNKTGEYLTSMMDAWNKKD